jgi:tRNA pseudouridine32 synthase/23S rRNA pseudouridine746 synthase
VIRTDPTIPPDAPLEFAYLDAHCLVVVKPSGLPSVPGRPPELHDCVAARVVRLHPDALVVHRLDMATSGLLAFARGAEAQRCLNAAFARREVEKDYVAIVDGLLEADEGEIDLPLSADWPRRPLQKVDPIAGKAALTRYRVLGRNPATGRTRVALSPRTGRAHQLRVHLLAIGHPIVGDALYAAPPIAAAADRLLLHATALRFAHPATGVPVDVRSPAPF